MTTYSGTAITGTRTAARLFKSSGLYGVSEGDWYENTETGHYYYCTTAGSGNDKGSPWNTKWAYRGTDVVGKPTATVKSLSDPKRTANGASTYKAAWKVPDSMTSDKNGKRATKLKVTKRISWAYSGKKTQHHADASSSVAISVNSATINIASFDGHNRQHWWPYTKRKVSSLAVIVIGTNEKGSGPSAANSVKMKKPPKPTVAKPTLDATTGEVTCSITPAADKGYAERSRTVWECQIKNIGSSATSTQKKWRKKDSGTSTSDSAFTTTACDLQNWQTAGNHYVVRYRAKSQGLAGDSGWTGWKSIAVGWPKAVTLGSVTIKDSSNGQHGYLAIKNVNSSSDYETTQVVLQALVSSSAATAAAAKLSASWSDTSSKDDAQCKGLSFPLSGSGSVVPDRGTHTWLRVKSWNMVEGVFDTFSDPVELKSLYMASATAADNMCIVSSAVPDSDGESVNVTVAWDKTSSSADDDTTSMELSWSSDEGAWKSTEQPETFEFDWKDGSSSVTGWNKTATVKVKGLEPETVYWFSARCIVDDNGTRTYGPYCTKVSGSSASAPIEAVLSAPSTVASGQGIPFTWGYSGGGEQTAWQLIDIASGIVLDSGEGPVQSMTLDAGRAASNAVNGVLSASVRVMTGGGTVDSAAVQVLIADAPVLSIGEVPDLAAQPLAIPLTCSISACNATVTVSADGSCDQMPYGIDRQAPGDTVWSDALLPDWEYDSENGVYAATVTLPEGCDFRDKDNYTIEAVATDPTTGLSSATASAGFAVDWSHQAPTPPDGWYAPTSDAEIDEDKTYYAFDSETGEYDEVENPDASEISTYYEYTEGVTVEPEVATDADGNVARLCRIQLSAPSGAAETDVYDVYRLTGDGAQLIGEGLAQDALMTDYYAPFGEGLHAYRIAVRTKDGDVEWSDFDYSLEGVGLRFDFDGDSHDYVELKWNIREQDSYAKDFKLSKAMDGTMAGAWNRAVERRGRYQTDVIRVEEQAVMDALRDLARTPDAVFVRTCSGLAFAANVNVDSMDSDSGACMAVSFTATEIVQDARFMGVLPVEDETTTTTGEQT